MSEHKNNLPQVSEKLAWLSVLYLPVFQAKMESWHFYDLPLSVSSLMPASLIQFDFIWMCEIREKAVTLLLLNRPARDKAADKLRHPDRLWTSRCASRWLGDRHLSKHSPKPEPNVSGFFTILLGMRATRAWQLRPPISGPEWVPEEALAAVRCCSYPTQRLRANVWCALWMASSPPVDILHRDWHFTADAVNGRVKKKKKEDRRQTERRPKLEPRLFVLRYSPCEIRLGKTRYPKWQVGWSVCL